MAGFFYDLVSKFVIADETAVFISVIETSPEASEPYSMTVNLQSFSNILGISSFSL